MTDSTATMTAQAEAVVRRHAARNFWLNVLDGGTFYLGLSMVSRFTVLPLFVERLSPDRWLQGLIPAINYTGWFLPGLFIVPLIAAMPRRKPILLTATLFERLPFLILGLVLLFWSDLPGASLLAIFLAATPCMQWPPVSHPFPGRISLRGSFQVNAGASSLDSRAGLADCSALAARQLPHGC